MAKYSGKYQLLSGNYQYSVFDVFLVDGRARINTDFPEDSLYLPNIWLRSVKPFSERDSFCTLTFTPRRAKLFTNNTAFLSVPLPWLEGSTDFNQFLIECGVNLAINSIGLLPEILSDRLIWLTI